MYTLVLIYNLLQCIPEFLFITSSNVYLSSYLWSPLMYILFNDLLSLIMIYLNIWILTSTSICKWCEVYINGLLSYFTRFLSFISLTSITYHFRSILSIIQSFWREYVNWDSFIRNNCQFITITSEFKEKNEKQENKKMYNVQYDL